ncbi:hypothetical protein CRU96_05755 [Malaciobacter halophilus]|nr:hypothetical protein [Malaciobacter halophilus]RYA23912.1 hypothetical protein CRU96_05755 [Malaciobacter halophilus]
MRSIEQRIADGDATAEEIARYKSSCYDGMVEEEREPTTKEKREWERVSGSLNFFRGNGYKYKAKRRKK